MTQSSSKEGVVRNQLLPALTPASRTLPRIGGGLKRPTPSICDKLKDDVDKQSWNFCRGLGVIKYSWTQNRFIEVAYETSRKAEQREKTT